MKKTASSSQKHFRTMPVSRDLTPDFRTGDHVFRYNASHGCHTIKPAGIHDFMFPVIAFVLGLLTLCLFLTGYHDGILFWLSIFFPLTAITALLKK